MKNIIKTLIIVLSIGAGMQSNANFWDAVSENKAIIGAVAGTCATLYAGHKFYKWATKPTQKKEYFVTKVGSQEQLDRLEKAGYDISNITVMTPEEKAEHAKAFENWDKNFEIDNEKFISDFFKQMEFCMTPHFVRL